MYTDDKYKETKRYLKSALGFTGSPWEGCIGDIARIPNHPCRNNSTQCAEGHNYASQYCLNSGRAEGRIDDAIIEKTLGITGMGNRTTDLTYFTFFKENYRQRKLMAKRQPRKLLSPREKRPKYEGAFIALKAIESDILLTGQINVIDSESGFVFVKKGQPKVLGGHLPADSLRQALAAVADAENVCATFDFEPAVSAIVPDGVPKIDGYYTVDVSSLSCYLCEFWIYHGSGTLKCKHIHAAEFYTEYKCRSADGGANAFMKELRKDFCTYIRNRERSKRREAGRDEILLKGGNNEVRIEYRENIYTYNIFIFTHSQILQHLKAGAVSTLEATTTGSNSISSTQYARSINDVLEKQQRISSRRLENKRNEVDENTCRICKRDDSVGSAWIGCDHHPKCLGGAGWYHITCVGLEDEENIGDEWICQLCREDDDDEGALELLLEAKREGNISSSTSNSSRIIESRADIISRNCTIFDGKVLFLEHPTRRSQEFIALDIQLHDVIGDITVRDGDRWDEYDGSLHELGEGDEIRFVLYRNNKPQCVSLSSRDILADSTDARIVGCKRDTYNRSELPSWLSSDVARPADIQKPQTKGIRISKYANPNTRLAPGSKRRRDSDQNTASKTAVQFVSNITKIKNKGVSTSVK